MSRYFLTKVWGFTPEAYPVLGFNSAGGRTKFVSEAGPGDWVVLAGTRDAPTPDAQRGRLLGMVQLGRVEVNVVKLLREIGTDIPDDHYTKAGSYRWPYGLIMLKARSFEPTTDTADVFGDYISGTHWASFALPLDEHFGEEKITHLASLPTQEAALVEHPIVTRLRSRDAALLRNRVRSVTGPGPSQARRGSTRDDQGASTYLLQLQGSSDPVFKIGFSTDLQARVATLNSGLLSAVTGYSWRALMTQDFDSAEHAYWFEQCLHRALAEYRVDGESEVYQVRETMVLSTWNMTFARADWSLPIDPDGDQTT